MNNNKNAFLKIQSCKCPTHHHYAGQLQNKRLLWLLFWRQMYSIMLKTFILKLAFSMAAYYVLRMFTATLDWSPANCTKTMCHSKWISVVSLFRIYPQRDVFNFSKLFLVFFFSSRTLEAMRIAKIINGEFVLFFDVRMIFDGVSHFSRIVIFA